MAKIYAHGSVERQTAHIAEYIADVIRAHGHQAETADLKHSADSIPEGPDGVIAVRCCIPSTTFLKRQLMKKIVRDKGSQDLDTSRDYIYTEWDGVKHFTEEFLATVSAQGSHEQGSGTTPPTSQGSASGINP